MAKQETLPEKQKRLKNAALLNAEIFYHYELIARATGITDDTLKKYRDTDEEFSEQLEKVRTQFIGKHIKRSKSEFLLERLAPDIFKQRSENDLRVKELPKPILGGATQDETMPAKEL